jgi:Secretion system C-terminal sorting domain
VKNENSSCLFYFIIFYISDDKVPVISYKLDQNYPNPFNSSTIIDYSVRNYSQVSIKVYDILGKEVSTLINTEKPAGRYSIEFNAAKLVSGIYFYRMQSGNFISTRKFILMK